MIQTPPVPLRSSRLPLLLIALSGVAVAACNAERVAAPADAPAAVRPQTAVAAVSADAPLAIVPAVVIQQPGARVAVTSGFTGIVRQVHVVEGAVVKSGQLLATIVSREAHALSSEQSRAEARLALARANAGRIGQLASEGVVAGARADEARAALREAEVLKAEADRTLALGNATTNGIVRLVAPIAGRVAQVATQAGGPVDDTTAPFVIDSGTNHALRLQLPERLAGRVRPGMAVRLPDGSRGRIISVVPGLDPATRSVTAIARIAGSPSLMAGGALSVTVLGSDAVVVPANAVTRLDGADVLFVADGAGFRPVAVMPGGSADGRTTILDGVAAGTIIAVSNLPELRARAGT